MPFASALQSVEAHMTVVHLVIETGPDVVGPGERHPDPKVVEGDRHPGLRLPLALVESHPLLLLMLLLKLRAHQVLLTSCHHLQRLLLMSASRISFCGHPTLASKTVHTQ